MQILSDLMVKKKDSLDIIFVRLIYLSCYTPFHNRANIRCHKAWWFGERPTEEVEKEVFVLFLLITSLIPLSADQNIPTFSL